MMLLTWISNRCNSIPGVYFHRCTCYLLSDILNSDYILVEELVSKSELVHLNELLECFRNSVKILKLVSETTQSRSCLDNFLTSSRIKLQQMFKILRRIPFQFRRILLNKISITLHGRFFVH